MNVKITKPITIIILVCLLIYLLILQTYAAWLFTIDDMYIPLRYAKNLFLGQGLVWNINEPPVEGYSSFLFVIFAYFSLFLNLDPVIILKIAGISGLCFSSYAIFLLSRFWHGPFVSSIPVFWFLAYKGQILWAVSGLETTVYQAVLYFSLFFILKALGYKSIPDTEPLTILSAKIYWFLTAILFFILVCTRPEAIGLITIFYVLAWYKESDKKFSRHFSKDLIMSILLFLCLFLPYFIWRWYYYGLLFPNPIYCKGFANFNEFALIKNYLLLAWPFLLLSLVVLIKKHEFRFCFFLLPNIFYLTLLLGAEPVSAFLNRLFLPAFGLLLPLSLCGLIFLISIICEQQKNIFYYLCLILSSILIWLFCIPSFSVNNFIYFNKNPQRGLQLRTTVAMWLTNNLKHGSEVVLADAGLIPYLNMNLNFIDSYCLNNKKMIYTASKERYKIFCQEIVEQKPEVIILTSYSSEDQMIFTPADKCLVERLQKNNEYKLNAIYQITAVEKRRENNGSAEVYRYEIYQK